MLAYAADFDQTLPGKNWMDASEAYTKDPDAYRSPAVGGEGYGFALNEALVGKSLAKISGRGTTVMLFDSTKVERNAIAGLDTMPKPARYGTENTVAFADGSVRNQQSSDAYAEASGRLHKIGVALLLYSSDYDDHLPLAKTWMDGLTPYVTSQQIFHDPALGEDQYGFALNKDVASKSTSAMGPIGSTASVFTSTLKERNACGSLETMPVGGRYSGKNAILYLDGHTSDKLEVQNAPAQTPPSKPAKDTKTTGLVK